MNNSSRQELHRHSQKPNSCLVTPKMRVPLKILSVALVFLTFKCGKAQEITCTEPDIEHRDVDKPPKVYTEGETLKYRCKQGYKPREGTPHCTRYGWSIRPECEVILCVFNPTTYGKESISPLGKTLFKVGETLEITCAENYWIFSFSTKSKICTCREDGTWDSAPICQEKRCEVPRLSSLYYPGNYFKKTKLGDEVNYHCKSYYTKAAEYATCTEHGWEPNPLCIGCRTPIIPNGEIVEGENKYYDRYSTVKYRCREGFTPEKPVQIQCNYYLQWTGMKPCTEIPVVETPSTDETSSTDETPCPEVENGFVARFRNSKSKYYFSCNKGFKPFQSNWWEPVTCRSGFWSEQLTCIPQNKCGAFPSGFQTERTDVTRMYAHEDIVAVECGPGYRSGQKTMTCVNGIWDAPSCERVKCGIPPRVFNAVIESDPQEFYLSNSKVTYQCQPSFRRIGEETISCLDGEWETPPTCESEA